MAFPESILGHASREISVSPRRIAASQIQCIWLRQAVSLLETSRLAPHVGSSRGSTWFLPPFTLLDERDAVLLLYSWDQRLLTLSTIYEINSLDNLINPLINRLSGETGDDKSSKEIVATRGKILHFAILMTTTLSSDFQMQHLYWR